MKTLVLAASAAALAAGSATAEVLLTVDLTVTDQITINATSGNSSATVSGTDGIGFLLADFFPVDAGGLGAILVSGDLTAGGNVTDGTPGLFNFGGSQGLNFWSWTNDASTDLTAGSGVFTGSATWDVSATAYANALAGPGSGTLYFPADDDGDIGTTGVAVGEWALIPEPGSLALLGLGGLAMLRRRR